MSSSAVFNMQAQKLTTNLHKEMDKRMRQFIWGSAPVKKKVHLLNWKTLCMPKKVGGAGLRRSKDMNKCLFAKLGWRVLNCGEGTLGRMMQAKYGISEGSPLHSNINREKPRLEGYCLGIGAVEGRTTLDSYKQ